MQTRFQRVRQLQERAKAFGLQLHAGAEDLFRLVSQDGQIFTVGELQWIDEVLESFEATHERGGDLPPGVSRVED